MTDQISTLLQEHRRFAPPADFAAQANAQPDLYEAARRDRLAFWEEQARALRASPATAGPSPTGSCTARWAASPTPSALGVKKGDRVSSTCPIVPRPPSPCWPAPASAPCTRWSSAASAPSRSRDRINDSQAVCLVTADGGYRRGAIVPLKKNVDDALEPPRPTKANPSPPPPPRHRRVLLQRHPHAGRAATSGGIANSSTSPRTARPPNSTPRTRCSSSTPAVPPGNPRASSTPPPATSSAAATSKYVFDLKPDDVFWCTADVGWVTGHSYVVYGPLANGATGAHVRRAPPTGPNPTASGASSSATASPSSTPRPPPSAPS
jgi:acetyl-CoA synthetase